MGRCRAHAHVRNGSGAEQLVECVRDDHEDDHHEGWVRIDWAGDHGHEPELDKEVTVPVG